MLIEPLILEIEVEQYDVVMWAQEFRAVFTTGEITDSPTGEVLTQTFEKIGEMLTNERTAFGQVLIIVGERYETVLIPHLGFVGTADSPFARMVEATVNTLATRELDELAIASRGEEDFT